MKFDITLARTYPHAIDKVWRAITDRAALAVWLMDNDFTAEAGAGFHMWCDNGEGGRDRFVCRVLELAPPNRMVWSWVLDGRQRQGETRVEFHLQEVPGGTRLTIRHSGARDRDTVERFKAGWPGKLDALDAMMNAAGQVRFTPPSSQARG